VKRYVLDTNVYIRAGRDESFGAELTQFVGSFLPQIYLHAVVVQELARGAINAAARRRLDQEIIQPFEKRGRIVVPRYSAWKRSGEVIAELVDRKKLSAGGIPQSLVNDTLLAVSCREDGVTLITMNAGDFDRIALVEKIIFEKPWPRN
jgi:predicted nucleic acid-binding protein